MASSGLWCVPGVHALMSADMALLLQGGTRGVCHLQNATGGWQEVPRLHGRMRVVGPGLPGLPLELHGLAQRGEGLLEAALLRYTK